MKKLILLSLAILILGCEQPTEYITEYINTETIIEVEIEKEVIITETITEYIDVEIITEKEVIVIEYVDREIIVEKYIEVDKIVEIIKEVPVDRIIETEKIIEVQVIETVTEYVDRTETIIEYVDRIETVVEYIDRIETITEYIETEKLIDNIINTETIIYITKEVYIVTEQEIFVQPIQTYDNYVTLSNKVYGIIPGGFEEIPLIKDLFKIGGILYFTVDDKFYSQTAGKITELETQVETPRSEHIEFSFGIFEIEKTTYKDEPISKMYKHISETDNPTQGRYMIDGACIRGNDLLFSAPIDTGKLLKGVWIWPLNGSPTRFSAMDNGRIW